MQAFLKRTFHELHHNMQFVGVLEYLQGQTKPRLHRWQLGHQSSPPTCCIRTALVTHLLIKISTWWYGLVPNMLDNTPLTQPSEPRVTKAMQLLVRHRGLKVHKAMLALGINCLDNVAPNKQMWMCHHLQKAVLTLK